MSREIWNACATTFCGFEDIAVQELQELLGKKAISVAKGFLLFSATDQELVKLCYKTQSLRTVLRLYSHFSFSSTLASLKSKALFALKKADLSVFAGKKFRAVCDREGIHSFTSQEVAAAYGEIILSLQKNTSVDLTAPELLATCLIRDDACYLCLDFAGFDLSKREYKIYSQPDTLNSSFAYCIVRFSGYTLKERFLDPMCGVGTLLLESALFASKISPRRYQKDAFHFHRFLSVSLDSLDKKLDKNAEKRISITGFDAQLRHVEAAKKMAKLAGVSKYVSFARADVDWLDTKAEKDSVDILVTHPPVEGRAIAEKDMEKLYKEFFYQIEFVMKKTGKVVLVCQKTDALKKALEHFTIISEHTAWQGAQKFVLVTLRKKETIK